MIGTISAEKEVNVPASAAWELYGSLKLAELTGESLPDVISKIVIDGDGGVGTIVEIFFPPGHPGVGSFKEKFTVVDDTRRVKETEAVEGGYLDLGFNCYRVRLEVIEMEGREDWCVTRATIEYELKEDAAANASIVSIQPLVTIMDCAANHLVKSYVKAGIV